jgi:hypothetical protein
VYLENEVEIVQKATGWVGDLKQTVGYKLLQRDPKSKIVINFHGVSICITVDPITQSMLNFQRMLVTLAKAGDHQPTAPLAVYPILISLPVTIVGLATRH